MLYVVAERKLPPGITRHERKSGERYEVRWRPGPGEPEQSRSFPGITAAKAWKTQVDAARLHGQRLDPRAGKRIFGDYAAEWLEHRTLAPRTRELYQHLLGRYLLPAFGRFTLGQITATKVRAWHTPLTARGGTTGPRCYRLLRSILATAVEDGVIAENPCRIKNAGVEDSPERPFVPLALVVELAGVAHPRLRAPILVAGFGGLRLGELRALRVKHFNELAGAVTVAESIDLKDRRGPTKSRAGVRAVALPKAVVDEVAHHVAAYGLADPEAPLFPSSTGGPMSLAWHGKHWRAARVAAGVEGLHWHDLRHAAATAAAQSGATLRELMSRIGHSTPRAAMKYQAAAAERDRSIADRLGEMVADVQLPPRASVTRLSRDGRGTDPGNDGAQATH